MKNKLIILLTFLAAFSIINADENVIMNSEIAEEQNMQNKTLMDITIEEAVSLALQNNLGLKSENYNFSKTKWSLYTVWNTFLPDASLSLNLTKSNLDEDDRTTEISQLVPNPADTDSYGDTTFYNQTMLYEDEVVRPEWGAMLNFNLTFTFNAAMVFNVYQTVLDYQNGKLTVEDAKNRLVLDVKKNYYSMILQKKNIALFEQNLESARKRYEQAAISYNNGYVSEVQMLGARIRYENMKPSLDQMKNGYEIAMMSFNNMLGLASDVELNMTSSIEKPEDINFDIKQILNDYLDNNITIRTLKNVLLQVQNARNFSIASLTPTFQLGYTMDPTFMKDPMEDPWFETDQDDEDADRTWQDNWKQQGGMLRLTLSLPLSTWFPLSKDQVSIIGSSYAVKKTQVDLQNTRNQLEIQVRQLVKKIENSIDTIESLRLNVELAEKSYRLTEIEYNSGQKERIDVEEAEQEKNKALLNLLNAEFDYTTGILDLKNVLNLSDIEEINNN